ncbi:MAG: hypothetical protein AUI14_00210 [Actinobacteria bacterium 13_2_20CM_2_71_6]|nr:MAG: hypothetical protein AUI14_00210 [Actinobacteria bacterium 13_2_20CM_2_71_6]
MPSSTAPRPADTPDRPQVPDGAGPGTRRVHLRFVGADAGTAALTWAQRQVWDWIRTDFGTGRHGHLNAVRVVALPERTRVPDVLSTVRELLVRHEALRTVFVLNAAGQPEQVVAAAGELAVDIVETGPDCAAGAAEDLRAGFLARGIDILHELPLQVGVSVSGGYARFAVLVMSRMTVDNWGAGNLRRDFNRVLAAVRQGRDLPDPPDGRQPLAQARYEASPAGTAVSAAGLRHWQEQLSTAAQLAVPFLDTGTGTGPERIQRVVLRSAAVSLALSVLTRRHRVQASAVVLAAVAASLGTYTGLDASTFMLHCGNRIRAELRPVVGNLKQHTLVTVDTAQASFGEIIERSASALLHGYRYGQYDNLVLGSLVEDVRRARGVEVARSAGFNDLAFGTERRSGGEPPSPEQIRAALAETVVERHPLPAVRSHADFVFYLHEFGDRARFSAHVDTGRLPTPEEVFRGVERILVAAAIRDHELSDWVAALGVKPAARDGDWVFVDNSWIHLPTVRRLARDVLGDHPCEVFVLTGTPTQLGVFAAGRPLQPRGVAATAGRRDRYRPLTILAVSRCHSRFVSSRLTAFMSSSRSFAIIRRAE